jgi:hypothetical protein
MTVPTWLTPVLAIVGAVTGISGLWLSLLNFRRDRARVELTVSFNTVQIAERWTTLVTARNYGRRSTHVSHVALMRTHWWWVGSGMSLFASSSVPGETLLEGAKPWSVAFEQDGDGWEKLTKRPGYVRAFANVGGHMVRSKAFRLPDDLEKFKPALFAEDNVTAAQST